MEGFGADIALKMKSAIKAKLVELEAYVDDELPDYIMVMMANQKTNAQMTDDLTLFLGANAKKFTDWLHEVMERLQAVTQQDAKQKENGEVKTSKDPAPDAEKVSSSAKVHKSREKKKSKSHSQVPSVKPDKPTTEVEVNELEVLAIKAEPDADYDPLEVELQEDTEMAASAQPRVESDVEEPQVLHKESRRYRHSPIPQVRTKEHTRTSSRKRKAPSSSIGAVVHNTEVEDDFEEYDPRRPSIGTIASVVHVGKRRPSVPPELQANKKLIMRAVDEAQKSVSAASKKYTAAAEPKFTRPPKPQPEPEAVEILEIPASPQVELQTKEDDAETKMEVGSEGELEEVVHTVIHKKRLIHQQLMASTPKSVTRHEPQFIITLDGVNELHSQSQSDFERSYMDSTSTEDYDLDVSVPQADSDYEEEMEFGNDEVNSSIHPIKRKKLVDRCKFWPSCKNGSRCPFSHPSSPCRAFPNCKFGKQCLYLHPKCKFDASCTRKDCVYTHTANARLPVAATLKYGQSEPLATVPASSASLQRTVCKFAPKCNNVNCQYFHPTPCRFGFKCFRGNCLFIHPTLPSREQLRWSFGRPTK